MLAINTRKLSTTLLLTFAILIAVSTVAEAAHDVPLQQRDHMNLKRIVKKRSPQLDGPVPIGAAPIPDATTSSTTSTTTSASSTTSTAETSSSSTTTSATTSGSSTVSGSSSTSGTESATSSSTTTATSTTTPPPPATTEQPAGGQVETLVTQVKATKTMVKSVDAAETSPPPQLTGGAQTSSNVMTVLIAVAASIGGVAILWTIFRKWKLGSSKKFEDRLQPIDWKPSTRDDDDGIIPPHRRHSGSSFNSASRRNDPLDHDFTAGPANVSPVGGYADMSRGYSPQMRENRGYEHGPRY